MFPGLFIQPSVWLRIHSPVPRQPHHHPLQPPLPSLRALLEGAPTSNDIAKPHNLIGEEHNVVCVRRKKKGSNFYPHVFRGKLSTHSSI